MDLFQLPLEIDERTHEQLPDEKLTFVQSAAWIHSAGIVSLEPLRALKLDCGETQCGKIFRVKLLGFQYTTGFDESWKAYKKCPVFRN